VNYELAYARVRGPAGFLLLSGALALAFNATPAIVLGLVLLFGGGGAGGLPVFLIFLALTLCSFVIVQGAHALKRFERRPLVRAACLLSILPTSACWLFLTLPAGLWAGLAAARPEVLAAFEARARSRG
jgi:hypothetical protein